MLFAFNQNICIFVIMANKDKKNITSFTSEQMKGNSNAEKWTIKEAISFFDEAVPLSEADDCYFIGTIAKTLKVSRNTFVYLCEKFPVLCTKKEIIDTNIESNLFLGGLTSDNVNSTVSIFGLKNNHNWKDKQEITQDIKVKNDVSSMTTEELLKRAEATEKLETN